MAQVVIPRNLTIEEVKRLRAFLLALAQEDKPGQRDRLGKVAKFGDSN